jgi:hypothetical protein
MLTPVILFNLVTDYCGFYGVYTGFIVTSGTGAPLDTTCYIRSICIAALLRRFRWGWLGHGVDFITDYCLFYGSYL